MVVGAEPNAALAVSQTSEWVETELTRLDQVSREICRCFGNSDHFGVLAEFAKLNNPIETAYAALISADRMSPEVRQSFLRFLQFQVVSWRG
jgi:hypothetical protein